MREDPYKTIVWVLGLVAGGFALYWAYQNGMLGYFGACPTGWSAESGACVNTTSLQLPPSGGSPPTTPLAAGMSWGWDGNEWTQVPTSSSWNPTITL